MTLAPLTLRIRALNGIISTDDILPARYKHISVNPSEMALHVFENLLPGFAGTVQEGDALYAKDTFGIGSSREQAVSSLYAAGIRAVFAPRFGRIFFRNAWNLGLLAIELDSLDVKEGDVVQLDVSQGRIAGPFGAVNFTPPPPMMIDMVASGGLLALVQRRVSLQRAPSTSS